MRYLAYSCLSTHLIFTPIRYLQPWQLSDLSRETFSLKISFDHVNCPSELCLRLQELDNLLSIWVANMTCSNFDSCSLNQLYLFNNLYFWSRWKQLSFEYYLKVPWNHLDQIKETSHYLGYAIFYCLPGSWISKCQKFALLYCSWTKVFDG